MIDLIIKAQSGDKEAAETLIKENDGLIRNMMKKYHVRIDNEDFHSLGMYALYKSILTYDIESNYEFSTYASTFIGTEIYNELRKRGSLKNRMLSDAITLETPIGDSLTLGDTIRDCKAYREILEVEAPRVMESLYVLDELEQKIFMLRFIENMTIPEIIEALGIKWSSTYGSRKIAIIKAKLALALGIEYESKIKVSIKRFEKGFKGEVK